MRRKPPGRQLWLVLAVTVALMVTGRILEYRQHADLLNYQQLTWRAEEKLASAIDRSEKVIEKCLATINGNDNSGQLAEINRQQALPPGFSFYVYTNDRLVYWTDNNIVPDSAAVKAWENREVVLYRNGWYYIMISQKEQHTVVGMLLLKRQYAFQNKFLVNEFNSILELPKGTALYQDKKPFAYPVYNRSQFLFSITFNSPETGGANTAAALCYLCAIIAGAIFILNYLVRLARLRSNIGFLILAALIALRFRMIIDRVPETVYNLGLFSPEYYASSWVLNSLGDLLLNTLLFVLIIIYVYIYVGGVVLVHQARVRQYAWSAVVIVVLLATFLFSVLINYVLSGLIINSQISFNINNVFELTTYSIIGIFIIGILLLCFYLICDGAVRFIQKTHFGFSYVSILFLITQGIFLVLLIWLRDTEVFINYGVSAFLLANTLILFTTYIRRTSRRVFSFTRSLLVVLGFSVYAAQIIYEFNGTKERERRIMMAGRMEDQHDRVVEYLFSEVQRKLRNDPVLENFFLLSPDEHLLQPFLVNDVQKRLLRLYFTGYLARYDIDFKFFDRNDSPVNIAGDPSWNLDAIYKRAQEKGSATYSPGLYYINNNNGRIAYVAIVPLRDVVKLGTVVVEINARLLQDRNGFPELLVSGDVDVGSNPQNYSYARYENGRLISQSGEYSYYLTTAPYAEYIKARLPRFERFDNYSHLFYLSSTGGLIIISLFNLGFLVYITLFSYIFTFFSFLYILIYILARWAAGNLTLLSNFKSRIQFSLVSIVIVALGLVGGATIAYIINNYEQEQHNRIRQKLNDTAVLVENELIDRGGNADPGSDELNFTFNRLANILSLDFNLYNGAGRLLFTSQPKFYEQDLLAPVMNRGAYEKLTQSQKGIYIQNESIGSFNYISAYEPVRDRENRIIAYINLPYYARQSELNQEISSFLVALINIYVLLFSFAVFITFIISNRITQPLRIIQQTLKRTKLGTDNEPLVWHRKDEIGSLVNEYNRMVAELHRSAEMLARSERESAWREMAKQVAHEIKNPLTPMKLSVQHLQRAWRDNHPDLPAMVDRMSETLIEQIETLSSIASAFSDFAKMPKAINQPVDLAVILDNVVHLYRENEQANVMFEKQKEPLMVFGDKDQLIRVFSNLIKNGIQSVPSGKPGVVKVSVERFIDHYVIAVEDNGEGIPESMQNRIFVPNFTTKSTGTGLGLAMAKDLVEGMNGEIWFESSSEGTAFFVRLPSFIGHS